MTTKAKQKMGPLKQRRERRRTETREKLYRAAMELFAEHSFAETTTEDITEAADVGQGTFFNYFPTKAHVLVVLLDKQTEKVMMAQQMAEGKTSIRKVFQKLIHDMVGELASTKVLTRSLLSAFASNDAVCEVVSEALERGRDGLARICAIGQEQFEIRRDRKTVDLAMTFQRGVVGTLLLWAMQPKGDLHAWLQKTVADFWTVAEARDIVGNQLQR